MKTQYTKGVWYTRNILSRMGSPYGEFEVMATVNEGFSTPNQICKGVALTLNEATANAKLIAAAPEMLKMLALAESAIHEANIILNGRFNTQYHQIIGAIKKATE